MMRGKNSIHNKRAPEYLQNIQQTQGLHTVLETGG